METTIHSLLKKTTQNGKCLEWNGAKDADGYGRILFEGRNIHAHRVIGFLKFKFNMTDSSKVVCHSCDNRLCINPEHLWIGSMKDNTQDMLKKGRHRTNPLRGEASSSSKLSAKQVIKIRSLREKGESLKNIANMFGISFQHVSDISRHIKWTHI